MPEHPPKEETLFIIREIEANPEVSQRDLSRKLGFSLGKTNYLIRELIKVGLLEIKNFTTGNHKAQKIKYLLTKQGLEHKSGLIRHLLKKKEEEYSFIKKEYERSENNNGKT